METSRRRLLGEILVDARLIRPEQVETARAHQQRTGLRMGQALVALGFATEDDVAWALSHQLNLPYVHLTPEMITSAAAARVPMAVMERHRLIPIVETSDSITVVMADPTDHEAIADVARLTGLSVISAIGLASNIRAMLHHLRDVPAGGPEPDPGRTVLLFHLSAAMHAGATEVYFDPVPDGIRVRYRTLHGVIVHQGPGVAADALAAAVRAVGTPADDGWRFLIASPVAEPSAEIFMTLVPTHHGTAVLGSIGRRPMPGMTLTTLAIDSPVAAAFDEAVRTGGLIVVGTPDPAFRRLLLSTLASALSIPPQARVVGLGLPARTMGPDVVAGGLETASRMSEGLADVLIADVGPDLEQAARLARLRRPAQLLILGTPHLYADAAVGDLTALLGPWGIVWSLTAVLTGCPVPALCDCAQPMEGAPSAWPGERRPSRWGAPGGCDRCHQTGFDKTTFIYEWYRAGPELAEAGPAGSAVSFAAVVRRHAAPAIEEGALRAVERLQVSPDDAVRLLRNSRWTSRNS